MSDLTIAEAYFILKLKDYKSFHDETGKGRTTFELTKSLIYCLNNVSVNCLVITGHTTIYSKDLLDIARKNYSLIKSIRPDLNEFEFRAIGFSRIDRFKKGRNNNAFCYYLDHYLPE